MLTVNGDSDSKTTPKLFHDTVVSSLSTIELGVQIIQHISYWLLCWITARRLVTVL